MGRGQAHSQKMEFNDDLCASDSFIDTFLDAEGWFTFRTGSGGEYRAEIEKSLPQEKSFPFIVKQSGKPESREWEIWRRQTSGCRSALR